MSLGSPRAAGLGATVLPSGGAHFRVWAPNARRVDVQLETAAGPILHPLAPEDEGYYAGLLPTVRAGDRYRYQLDVDRTYPDP